MHPIPGLVALLLLVAVPCLAQAGGRTGVVTGRVASAASEAAVSDATVEVVGSGRRTTTGPGGRFVLDSVPVGPAQLRVTAIGYAPRVLSELLVGSGKPLEVEVRLAPRAVELEALATQGSYFRSEVEATTSTQGLGREEVRRAPGVQEDVVRALALLPGIGVTTGGRNDLVVRGGAPFENLFLVDGIEVPNLNHFGSQGSTGGPVSLLTIDFVREASFASGGFGPQYGDRTSSVTSIALREGNAERLAGSATLSATGFGASAEGPVGGGGTFLASVRRSYLDLIFKAAGFAFIPEYWDANVKVTRRLGARHQLAFLAVGALDRITLNNDSPDNRLDNSRLAAPDQSSYFAGLTWKWSLPAGLLQATLGRTWTRFDVTQGDSLVPATVVYRNRSTEGDNALRTDLSLELGRGATLLVGNTARWATRLRYDVALDGALRRDSLGDPAPLAADTGFRAFRNATYASLGFDAGPVRLSAGVRADWYRFLGNAVRVAPRVGASVPVGRRGLLTASAGRYAQAPSFVWLAGDPGNAARLRPFLADQVVVGYERLVRPDLKVQVEAYHKRYRDYPARLFRPGQVLQPSGFDDVTSDIPAGLEPLASTARGRGWGAEAFVQKKPAGSRTFGLASLSVSRTTFDGPDGTARAGAFDTRVIATVLGGWRVDGRWELSGKFRVASGLPYTPFVASGPLAGTRDAARYNTLRLPTFHALDVRVDRRWAFRGLQLDAYLDVQNVYGRKNVSGTYWNARTRIEEFDESLGVLPSLGVMVEF